MNANLDSPAPMMRALAGINAGQLVCKVLESIPGWFKVGRITTGISGNRGLGRIYDEPGGERVLVSVHIK